MASSQSFQLHTSYELSLNMPLYDLAAKLANIRAAGACPCFICEALDRQAKHLRRHLSRLGRHLRRSQALVLRTHQPIDQRVEVRPLSIERTLAHDAPVQLRQKAHQP